MTAEGIIDIYQGLGFDAVGVGPLDLAAGLDFLQNSRTNNFPWVSANLFAAAGEPLFPRWIRKTAGNKDIIITALTASAPQPEAGVTTRTWEEILPELLKEIRKANRNPFIILLSSLTDAENQRIAETYPEIHLLLGADRRKGNITPRVINGTLLTQTGSQGKYQGLLELALGSQRQWDEDLKKKLADLQNRLGSLNWQLKRLEKKAASPGNGRNHETSIARLHKEKDALTDKISALQNKLAAEAASTAARDQFTYKFIGLKKNMPSDPATEKKLVQLKRDIRDLNKRKKMAAKGAIGPGPNMLGNVGCAECHTPQAEFWKTTAHAKAYATLTANEKNLDLKCLPCHMTWDIQNAKEKEMPPERLLTFPEELQAVGCESCHGAGKKHSREPERYKTIRLPAKGLCLSCHTPEHDDNFDYPSKLSRISCPAE